MARLTLIFCILFSCLVKNASCQSKKIIAGVNNGSVKFTLIKTSMNIIDSGKIVTSATIVNVEDTERDKKKLAKLTYKDWRRLLHDETTDWAANLYLYDIYKKDASTYEIIKNAPDWRKCCKEKDIAFWEKELKDK